MSEAVPPFYLTCLRDLSISASIGIHGFERAARQQLLVSVALVLPEPDASLDDISTVQDYDFVRDGVSSLVAARHFELQETLCREILDLCLGPPKILGAVVKTEKSDVYPDATGVGCRMARFRDARLAALPWWSLTF